MYFHTPLLHEAQWQQITKAYQELADILISGADRQHALQIATIRGFCRAQESNIRALAETNDRPQFIQRLIRRSAPCSMEMSQSSALSVAIAADVQRQVIEL